MAIVRRTSPKRITGMLPETAEYADAKAVHEAAREKGIETCPFDIETFIKKHSITVIREEMADNDISGYIELRPGGRWVIAVNKYHNRRRQRFSLAHEFGHFCLDKDVVSDHRIVDAILFRDNKSDVSEQRANEFASQTLIPDDVFRACVRSGMRSISDLADRFDVSLAAIRYKAYKLGFTREY